MLTFISCARPWVRLFIDQVRRHVSVNIGTTAMKNSTTANFGSLSGDPAADCLQPTIAARPKKVDDNGPVGDDFNQLIIIGDRAHFGAGGDYPARSRTMNNKTKIGSFALRPSFHQRATNKPRCAKNNNRLFTRGWKFCLIQCAVVRHR